MVKYLLFFSRKTCSILHLAEKHSMTLIPAYIPTYLNVEADFVSQGKVVPRLHLLLHIAWTAFQLLGQQESICWHPHVPINVTFITFWNTHYLKEPWLNAFNHPWTFQVSYVFPPPALIPLVLSKFLVEHVTS